LGEIADLYEDQQLVVQAYCLRLIIRRSWAMNFMTSEKYCIDILFQKVRMIEMNPKEKSDSVWFTTKGQVVIPAWLRREFQIENGTRAVVQSTPDGILLKPVTKHAISRLRGILKRRPGEKSLAEEWTEHTAAEKTLEDAKYERSTRGPR
jgi:AbrB family looped-hinge helix DNA binding protein